MEIEEPTTDLCEYCNYCQFSLNGCKIECEEEQQVFFENNGWYFDEITSCWVRCPKSY